jgi:cell division protein FtsB
VLPHHRRGNSARSRASILAGATIKVASLAQALLSLGTMPTHRLLRIGVLAVMMLTLCAGERGLIRLVRLKAGCAAIKREIRELRMHRDELKTDLARYTGDPETIERAAREKLDLIRRGETVYKFPPGS